MVGCPVDAENVVILGASSVADWSTGIDYILRACAVSFCGPLAQRLFSVFSRISWGLFGLSFSEGSFGGRLSLYGEISPGLRTYSVFSVTLA